MLDWEKRLVMGESIINYDVGSKGASNYLSLAKEIISKNR